MRTRIVDDSLARPQVLSRRFTGNHYPDFFLHDVPKLLEELPLAVRVRMWYLHYGAPEHFSCAVRDVLIHTYHDRWIGRGRPTAWTPCSPDLNPLDFYLWGHLKPHVY
jgi:hypothetical protein